MKVWTKYISIVLSEVKCEGLKTIVSHQLSPYIKQMSHMRKEIGEFKSYVKVWKQLFPIVTDLHSKCPIWEEKLENCLKFNFFISVNETKGMFEQIQRWKVKTHVLLFSMLVIEYAPVWINMHDHTFVQQDILFCFPMFWNKSFTQFVANLIQKFQLGVKICPHPRGELWRGLRSPLSQEIPNGTNKGTVQSVTYNISL